MLGSVFTLVASCIIAVNCQPNPETIKDCKTTIDAMTPVPSDKGVCMHACIGMKEGWLNGDGSINVDKKLQWANNAFTGDNLTKFKNALDKCKDVAKGQSGSCAIGTTIKTCMENNGAPPPPHPPPN